MRLPYAPADDRNDMPIAAFAHNNPLPHYGLGEPVLLEALQAYYACISFIDAQVGRLLDALDTLALSEKTVVVFWSDHGYHLGEHGGIWQKRTLFEESARAPLIIRVPGVAGNGKPCRRVVEFVDIFPTLAAATGISAPVNLDGQSLLPLLRNPDRIWNGHAVTQILRPADDRLANPVMGTSIRTERWRYTEWAGGTAGTELYDHQSDQMEFQNLAIEPRPADTKVIESLRSLLHERASGQVPDSPINPERL